ncbi:hypothetical protein O6H91_01G148900 [Diphasiastrum complanatum]|uniref:Uncharacterized protein n=1 Tax=Diphasiastrum complanatum TaxID=34168 RepID=A0ACC2EX82_DIPCM|nr:hypothetical protein O6H91_Y294500 [Diphasiastrum complanatum]KAJ7571108.1 hypothetical protein O6H91_01G148900 [Diphasiastrum complanatum]
MDDWVAIDKAQHFLACLAITILVSLALGSSPLLRRWRILIGCMVGVMVGAAKEAGDELKMWASEGASFKDAVADIAGVIVGASVMYMWTCCSCPQTEKPRPHQEERDFV